MKRIWPLLFVAAAVGAPPATAPRLTEVSGDTAQLYACEVDRRLEMPEDEQRAYAERLAQALSAAGLHELAPQHVLLVDRHPLVQAVLLYRVTPSGRLAFAGASPVSTGQPGSYEHFATPLGVFEHTLANPDFRAEGTRNENGVRGYGLEGRRVFDFGWVDAPKGWGDRAESVMRLQVHATDPDLLEPQLGRPRSKGCIRIPAALDEFLDRRGILDLEYLAAADAGASLWVLRADRDPTRWPGKYLVVIESARTSRPAWASPPRKPARPAGCEAP